MQRNKSKYPICSKTSHKKDVTASTRQRLSVPQRKWAFLGVIRPRLVPRASCELRAVLRPSCPELWMVEGGEKLTVAHRRLGHSTSKLWTQTSRTWRSCERTSSAPSPAETAITGYSQWIRLIRSGSLFSRQGGQYLFISSYTRRRFVSELQQIFKDWRIENS